MNTVEQVKRFLEPRSVALIGISRRTGEGAFNILESLLSYGYEGKIFPVNPNTTEILGVKTYPRIADVSDEVDLAVINLPRSLVPGTARQCVEKGVRSIIIITQGFADAGDEEGNRLQRELDELIEHNEVRILGPNSLGTVNTFAKFSSSFARMDMTEMPTGVVCQTGVFFEFPESVLIGKGIDLGNACDIGFAESLEYFEHDDDIKVVALHIEGVRDGRRFVELAGRLARRKPVIALKVGTSEHAANVAKSHTGSLVGRDEVWESALRQSGVTRVRDTEEFSDLVRAFSSLPLMKKEGVGIVSSSGGFNIINIDACHRHNLEIARLSPVTLERLNTLSPSWQHTDNPADMWPACMVSKQSISKVVPGSIDTVLNDHEVGAALLVWWLPTQKICSDLCRLMKDVSEAHPDKPLVCFFHGPYALEARQTLEITSRIKVFPSPDRAVRALSRLAQYSRFRRRS